MGADVLKGRPPSTAKGGQTQELGNSVCITITLAVLILPAQDSLPHLLRLSFVNCQTHFLSLHPLPRPSDPQALLSLTWQCWDPALLSEFITHFLA